MGFPRAAQAIQAALWWLPTLAVALMTALALLAAFARARRAATAPWIAAVLVCGMIAIGGSAWQQRASAIALGALGAESAQLRDLSSRLEARITELEGENLALREKFRARAIDQETMAKMADYLRQFGSFRVVLSCAPDDVEAFNYANQIANVLRAAGWDALGPETTTIFGEAPAVGITLYLRGGAPPEAAKILLDALTRFNIPYRSGIIPSDAIPDPATVELFVGHKS